jgi:hypothetical protein
MNGQTDNRVGVGRPYPLGSAGIPVGAASSTHS